MRRSIFTSLLLLCALTANAITVAAQRRADLAVKAVATSISPKARRDAERITAAQLRKDLLYIASDEMAGRDTPSPGLDMTAEYIAARMRSLKAKPAGDGGTYFQRIPLTSYRMDTTKTRARIGTEDLRFGEDFVTTLAAGTAQGKLIYVGHGWVVRSKNINAYQGLDVRDKIMVVSGIRPEGVTPADLTTDKQGSDWEDPATYAQRNGARGIILLPRAQDRARAWRARRAALEGGYYVLEDNATAPLPTVPTLIPSDAMLARLFAGERVAATDVMPTPQMQATPAAFDFSPAKTFEFAVEVKREQVKTQNVIAVIEGSDPVLKNEYVAIGAHYDHVGTGQPVNGDAIFNGADDDGSGTVAMLALAEAFAKGQRPKRSILFVWHAGEEKGLWGSKYFVEHPTVPLTSIVAQLNIDMIGRSRAADDTKPANANLSGPNEIYVIGSKMMSTELGALSERVNRDYLNVAFNYKYDDPADTNRFFFRSDHYNYAAKGIPIIFYFSGVHEDYHRPSDSPDKIDYAKMERVTRTVFMTASELAAAPRRPAVDKQLPAELRSR